MTSINALLGGMPSLVDFLGNGSRAGATSGHVDLAAILSGADAGFEVGDVVSLSAQAKQMIAAQQAGGINGTGAASADAGKAAKTGATDFVIGFFEESGVDLGTLSDEALSLLKGIGELINGKSGVGQDKAFDAMTKAYVRGERESFTLQGAGQRLTSTIQYNAGKPVSLTVTDIQGTVATTAVITLGRDEAGKPTTIEVNRYERQYNTLGGLAAATTAEPLSLPVS